MLCLPRYFAASEGSRVHIIVVQYLFFYNEHYCNHVLLISLLSYGIALIIQNYFGNPAETLWTFPNCIFFHFPRA